MKHLFFKMLFGGGLILSINACSSFLNVVQHYPDEFKKTDKFILNQYITPDEKKSLVQGAYITYEKEKGKSAEKVMLYFALQRATISFNVGKKGFLKTGGQSFEIEAVNLTTEGHSQTESSDNVVTTSDSTGVKTAVSSSSETKNWLQDKFKLELSPEMMNALQKGNDLILRFYAGALPITLTVKNKKWAKVKVWLQS
jgi:hypothetical protein